MQVFGCFLFQGWGEVCKQYFVSRVDVRSRWFCAIVYFRILFLSAGFSSVEIQWTPSIWSMSPCFFEPSTSAEQTNKEPPHFKRSGTRESKNRNVLQTPTTHREAPPASWLREMSSSSSTDYCCYTNTIVWMKNKGNQWNIPGACIKTHGT